MHDTPFPVAAGLFAVTAVLFAACTGMRSGATADATALDAACTQPYTQVGAIQGVGAATPMPGRTVTTSGVVVGDYEGPAPALRGFYIQDPSGDDDAATSDAVFVFNGDRDDVNTGDVVRVTGVVDEAQEQTQIAASSIIDCGTGRVTAADLTLPLVAHADLERFEGMLVHLPQTLYVTDHYQLGRYGAVVLSAGGRLPQPTAVAAPGADARAVQAANDLNRIIIDDASVGQNPDPIVFARRRAPLGAGNTLRGGDHATGITGVLTHTPAADASGIAYRVRPLHALGGGVPAFAAANPRTDAPPDVGGTLRVASFNVLNYFNTFDGCAAGVGGAPTECRGAADAAEFERQWRKIVAAVVAMDADILGIIEIENDGYDAHSAIAHLVDRLNAATQPGRFAFIDVDAAVHEPNALGKDAIRVGLIYRPARVSPTGRTAVLNTAAFVNAGEASLRNRPALAQAFAQPDGGRVIVSISHLKSKGSACVAPDARDGQGHCNAVRTTAARELLAWLGADPTGTGDPDVLILGDLNAYAREDPVAVLTGGGYHDLLAVHAGAGAYSYVFGGQWGYLDHALASSALLRQVTGAATWSINADEPPVLDYDTSFRSAAQQVGLYRADPFRSADHDPVIVGLRLDRD